MKRIYLLIVAFTFGSVSLVNAQDWVGMMRNPKIPVQEVQKAFYKWYTENRRTEKETTGEDGLVESFKRWENYMVPRSYPGGVRPEPVIVAQGLEQFRKKHESTSITLNQPNWSYAGNLSVPTGGGDGRINHLRFYPGSTTKMYACSPGGGLWKTTNGGTSWSTNTDTLQDLTISDIAINPVNPQIMYLGTGDNASPWSGQTTIGVLKSTDGGTTWKATGFKYTLQATGPYYMVVNELQINPSNPNMIWAATSFGLFRTTDAGVTWTNILNDNIQSLELEPLHSSTIYAATYSGQFYRSVNDGTTFAHVQNGLPPFGTGMTIGVSPADSNRVYILALDSAKGYFHSLYMSTDRGQHFTLKSSRATGAPNILGSTAAGTDSSGNGWYSFTIAVSQTNADTVFVGGIDLWLSGDKGVTWGCKSQWYGSGAPYVHADQHHLTFVPGSGNTVFAACDGGLFKTTDLGTTWTDYSNNLEIGQLYSVGVSTLTPGLYISGWQDNGTNYPLPSWNQLYGGDGEVCFIDRTNNSNLFVSWQNGNLLYSNNGGSSFNSATTGITETGPWTTRWLQDPQNPILLYAGFVNVWQSGDLGNSWASLSNWGTSSIVALEVAPSNNQYIYAAQYDSIFMSNNQGSTWTNINGNLPLSQAYLTDIAVDASNPLKAFVTFSGYTASAKVFETKNGGHSWINLSVGLPNLPVNTIVYHANSPDGIYVGTDKGIYYRDSTMNTWASYNTGLPNVMVNDLAMFTPNNTVVAGTWGRGTWESPAAFSAGISEFHSTAGINVYPNPGNGKMTVQASGLEEGEYVLEVVDLLGQTILHHKLSIDGNLQKTIDLSTQSPGVYILSFRGLHLQMEKKVIVN